MRIREKINYFSHNLSDYLLLLCSLGIIFSAGIYYLYALNWASIIVILSLTIISFLLLHKYLFTSLPDETKNISNIKEKIKLKDYTLFLLYFLLYLLCLYLLFKGRSDRALISPWQTVKNIFFLFYAFDSLILLAILLNKKISATGKLIGLSAHYFLSFSIAAIVYKIGYGFDPFIHQATMELIDKKGLVTPKPLYYLGEYGLVVMLHKLSGISIYLLNKFLVPVMAALFLPLGISRLTEKNNENNSHWLAPLFLIVLTFSPFILSTPQNLSYLFLILTITFGLAATNPLWSLILAGACTAIHPLTGIPALCWWLALMLFKHKDNINKSRFHLWRSFLFIASSLILPLALFISGGSDFRKISLDFRFIIEPIKNLFIGLSGAGQENFFLNFVYFFAANYNVWLILIIIASLFFFYQKNKNSDYNSLIFINLALVVAYLISSQILFTDLINYEQNNFAGRLLVLITIFFLPFIITGLQNIINLILDQNKLSKVIWLSFGIILITTSLYISYPRFDKYFNSRGYSTSQNDIEAVNYIEKNAKAPYIVLANQQVSVAALKELGFDHYYKTQAGLLYFYPIPTGGDLYQYYLNMVYKNPSQETMAKARALTGVKESYLVINKYWFQSDRIINQAKLNADSMQNINNEVYIFKFLP